MKCDKKNMLLYAVTDRRWVGRQSFFEQLESALKGGVTCVQLREKNMGEADFLEQAKRAAELCRRYGVPLIINDNAEVAVKSGADGVHVGQHDMQAGDVRSMVGSGLIVGVSVHSVEEAVEAVKNGADYLGAGSVFSTSTKADASLLPLSTLRGICAAVDVPVVAIGGINRDNILRLAGTGVDGAALVSAIFAADDIESECRELRALSERMVRA